MSERAVELANATIDSIAEGDEVLELRGVVYVRDPEAPGFQEAVIRVKDGVCEREELDFPCLLDGGSLALESGKYDDVIPLPLEEEGEVALLLSPAESSEFVVRGDGIEIELLGPQE